MKDVGFTNEGGRLVEMSREEYDEFSRLSNAVEGKFPDWARENMYAFREGYDFSKTFEVIRAFYDAHFRITALQEQINAMKDSLNK